MQQYCHWQLTPISISTEVYMHAFTACMTPHLLTCTCHTVVSFIKNTIKPMPLKLGVGHSEPLLEFQKEQIMDDIRMKLITKMRSIGHIECINSKCQIIDQCDALCRSTGKHISRCPMNRSLTAYCENTIWSSLCTHSALLINDDSVTCMY